MAPRPSWNPDALRPDKSLLTAWLMLLLLDGGASYGYELRGRLEAHELRFDPGNMYRTLRKLEAEGWVRSRWTEPIAGPRRRSYELTAEGRSTLDAIATSITAARDIQNTFLLAFEQTPPDAPRRLAG